MFKFVVTKNLSELFHRAVLQNDMVRVKLLLEQANNESKFNIDGINEDGLTALQFSCFASNLEIVRLLVEHGANVKIQDRDGWTLSHAAALGGTVDIVRYLAKLGVPVGRRNDDGQLPIDLATDIPTVIILLKYMLENGHHDEVQAYLVRHPDLKHEISREINIAIQHETEERLEMESLPYTSHHSRRLSHDNNNNNTNSLKYKRKVRGAFSMLPSPMQANIHYLSDDNDGSVILEEPDQQVIVAAKKNKTKGSKSSILMSSGSSIAESDSSTSDLSNHKIQSLQRVHRTASSRSDEYYNYYLHRNKTRQEQRDEEVRRSICLGNIGKELPASLNRGDQIYQTSKQFDVNTSTQPVKIHKPVSRTASIQYPEVYI